MRLEVSGLYDLSLDSKFGIEAIIHGMMHAIKKGLVSDLRWTGFRGTSAIVLREGSMTASVRSNQLAVFAGDASIVESSRL